VIFQIDDKGYDVCFDKLSICLWPALNSMFDYQ